MNRDEIIRKQKEYIWPSVATYYSDPLVLERGKGTKLYDTDGTEYLDFFGGILTVSAGHCHEEIVEKVNAQNARLQHTSTLYPTEPQVNLAEKLAELTPGRLQKSFFTNSGTEANETAVMIARLHTDQQEIVALRHGYSGRSAMAMTLTGHSTWRASGTQILGIKHAHNAYCYRCPFRLTYPSCDVACARDMEELIHTTTTGKIAAFLGEPIQGVGGFIVPPPEYFQIIFDIVKKHDGLFIADEVQTGFARTGKHWFGIEHWGIEPDIMVMAKGIANGAPMGATVAVPEVADSFTGLTVCTFGGNPVSSTAALATIEVLDKYDAPKKVEENGALFHDGLKKLADKHVIIGDVRGLGLMQAIELVKDRESREPSPEAAVRLFEETRKRKLIIGKGGLYGNVIRITPPLTVSKEEIEEALRLLDESLSAMA